MNGQFVNFGCLYRNHRGNDMENKDYYSLEELIKLLEEIKKTGEGKLSMAKAIYTLSMEIQELKKQRKKIDRKIN